MKRLVFLLCLILLAAPAAANPLDDLWGFIFPEMTTDATVVQGTQTEVGKITNVQMAGDKTTVSYEVPSIPSAGGITVELFCKDNAGYNMSVWGASVVDLIGSFATTPQEIGREDIDGCYFAVVDSTAEMMR